MNCNLLSAQVKELENNFEGTKFTLLHAKGILLRLFLKNRTICTDELTEREKKWIQKGKFFLDGNNNLILTLDDKPL